MTPQPRPARRSIASQDLFGRDRPEPAPDAPPAERVAWLLEVQADACETMGSPLYAHLLRHAAADARDEGPVLRILAEHTTAGRSDALALRFMAAVHRLVLTDRAPDLARHYPSAGGRAGIEGAWPALRDLLEHAGEQVADLVTLPCQTNEVGRCAGLAWGMLQVASNTRLPLRLLEVGTSAGLLLRWDHYRYGGAGVSWGPADSPVDLDGSWAEPPPSTTDVEVAVAERRGCDPAPVDPTSPEGELALRSAVWADQRHRHERLTGALHVARRVPARVDRASVDDWLPAQLAQLADGTATVVFHSVVEEYLDAEQRASLHEAVRTAGARATSQAPVAWLRLEPISELRHHGLRLATWPSSDPDGDEQVLAVCGAHGSEVRRPPG